MIEINPVFDLVPGPGLVRVHDYLTDNHKIELDAIRYVPENLVSQPAMGIGEAGPVLRAILSPHNILDMLQGKKCVCGTAKEAMRPHCPACYNSLPSDIRGATGRKFKKGYEAAFLISLVELCKTNRTDRERILAAIPEPKDVS